MSRPTLVVVSGGSRISIPAPAIDVDTTAGYNPEMVKVVEDVNRPT